MEKNNKLSNDTYLAAYMAGLLESDGAIVLKKKSENKQEIEKIIIKFCFNKDDKGYAEFLRNYFNMGQVTDNKESYSTEWCIYALEDIYNFLFFINGYLRTAKIVTLNKAFNFFKKKYNIDTIVKPLDTSDFLSNSWFSGFSDGDSSFQITLAQNKEKKNTFQIKPYYQLEVSEFYIKETEEYLNYRDNRIFMQPLAKTFDVSLLQKTRSASQWISKETYKLKINIIKTETIFLLIDYFTNFPLFSSKYLNYLVWKEIFDLKQETKSKNLKFSTIYTQVDNLRQTMNKYRSPDNITWTHLKHFYTYPKHFPNKTFV